MAYNDKCGEINEVHHNDSEYMADCMHFVNSLARKTATYKYAFFKSILDNLFNVNGRLELSFDKLSYSFSKMYWNLIIVYDLPQFNNTDGVKSLIEKEIDVLKSKYDLNKDDRFDVLNENIRNEYISKTKNIISINVVGALFKDLNKNIYGFDKKTKKIWFNQESYSFLIKYKSALEKLNYYAWIIWMENILNIRNKKNSKKREEGNLATKLDESTKRMSLESFKNDLYLKGDRLECFYCGKEIDLKKCHMDHFVPWSFVKDDQIWNLVFSCSRCNESKNNMIPSKKYLDKIIDRNKTVLMDENDARIIKLYKSALDNGFAKWEK